MRTAGVTLAIAVLATPALAAQQPDLPDGVTPAMIADGRKLFAGAALCGACHGATGTGGAGPNLTDTLWLHSSGTFEDIVLQVTTGVPQAQAKTNMMMPPRSGAGINDAQVRAVAAYVWSLSHQGK